MRSVQLNSVNICSERQGHILDVIREQVEEGKRLRVATPNPEMMLIAARDRQFQGTLNAFDVCIPDGVGLVHVGRLLGKRIAERVTGVDFMTSLAGLAEDLGIGVFLLGETRMEDNLAAQEALKRRFRRLRVGGLGAVPIYVTPEGWSSSDEIRDAVNAFGPCFLFVAFGQKKQEEWILEHASDFPEVRLAMGIGGAMKMIGGTLPRAPRWMRRFGFEWLWRLLVEPWRILRIFRAVVLFPVSAIVHQHRSKK